MTPVPWNRALEWRTERPGSRPVTTTGATQGRWPLARIAQWLIIATLVVVSEPVAWAGHPSASYAVDGAALSTFVGFRRRRRSPRLRR
jgi:hypothetical protein